VHAGQWRFTGKAELIGGLTAQRERERAQSERFAALTDRARCVERGGGGRGETVPTGRPHQAEGEMGRGRVSAGWRWQAGSACQREGAGAHAGARRWAKRLRLG
jgi:hypothetical protein